MTLIKSISGIRGTIGGEQGDNLTPADVLKFTTAYARWLKEMHPNKSLKAVVGRDARISGPMVQSLVQGALMGCGVDVIDAGLCTTPGVEMAVILENADGGIIITASHNPGQWNALKLLNERGEFLNAANGQRILELAADESYVYPQIEGIGKLLFAKSYDQEHIDRVLALKDVDVEAVRAKKFKVAVDAVNSVGGVVIPELLRQMGVEVVELYCTPDGKFPHNPEPLPDHLKELRATVVKTGADLGVSVDPDVDRLALVCENGEMFGEEYTLVAVADYILSKTPGNTVSNLSSSRALSDVTLAHGGKYAAAAVGEVNVVEKMKQTGAVIGGEGNGGVIFPALHYGRDALVGVALFLTHLARSGKTVSQMRAEYPAYYMSKNKIELTPGIDVDGILLKMKEAYKEERVTDIDGVKIDFKDCWAHLRKSNTEPIIRIYTEAKTQPQADELAQKMVARIKELI